MTCRFGAAVDLVGLGMQDADALGEHGVFEHVPRWRSILPGVVAAGRDIEHAAHGVHGKSDLLRAHELEDGVNVLSPLPANQAVAFDIRGFPLISLSILRWRFSRRRRDSSSRSALVSASLPGSGRTRSMADCACCFRRPGGPRPGALDRGIRQGDAIDAVPCGTGTGTRDGNRCWCRGRTKPVLLSMPTNR